MIWSYAHHLLQNRKAGKTGGGAKGFINLYYIMKTWQELINEHIKDIHKRAISLSEAQLIWKFHEYEILNGKAILMFSDLFNVPINKKIIMLRERKNMSQSVLAKQVWLTRAWVSELERWNRWIKVEELDSFWKALDVSKYLLIS